MKSIVTKELDQASNYAALAATLCLQAKSMLTKKTHDEVKKLSLELTRISAALTRISILNKGK